MVRNKHLRLEQKIFKEKSTKRVKNGMMTEDR